MAAGMTFKYYYPLQVRYSDFDTQWHVNNARLATFLEQARLNYIIEVGLFNGESFLDFPFVVADLHIAFREPILLGEPIRVGVQTTHIGTKSVKLEYSVENPDSSALKATADTVLVAYDNRNHKSIVVPQEWRIKFEVFEERSFSK